MTMARNRRGLDIGARPWTRPRVLARVVLAACLCFTGVPVIAADAPLEFTPQAGFEGASQGRGTLRLLGRAPRAFRVESNGRRQPDGTFWLAQTIFMQGKARQQRTWLIRTLPGNRYEATLSDAAGRVTGSHAGRTLLLRYRITGPLVMHQRLDLSTDGRTIANVGVIRAFGVPIGRLDETITRAPPSAR